MTIEYRDKTQNASADTGRDANTSIKPPLTNENVTEAIFGRSLDNLRKRTEEIKRANVKDEYFRSLEAAAVRSVIFVDGSNNIDTTKAGVYSVHREDIDGVKTYFITPGDTELANNENNSIARLIISGATNRGMQYNFTPLAFSSYYTTGVQAGGSPVRGLQKLGDSIGIRVPRLSTAEESAKTKNIETATSVLSPAQDALIGASTAMSTWLGSSKIGAGDKCLITTPLNNTFKFELNTSKAFAAALKGEFDAALAALESDPTSSVVEWTFVCTDEVSEGVTTVFKSIHIVKESETVYYINSPCYQSVRPTIDEMIGAGPNREKFIFQLNAALNGLTNYKINPSEVGTSGVTVTQDYGVNPPSEFILPLATHAGDKITIHGVGEVLINDVDTLFANSKPVKITNAGVVLLESGTAATRYIVRNTISYSSLNTAGYTTRDRANNNKYYTARLNLNVSEAPAGTTYNITGLRVYFSGTASPQDAQNKEIALYYEDDATTNGATLKTMDTVAASPSDYLPILPVGTFYSDDLYSSDLYAYIDLSNEVASIVVDRDDDALLVYFALTNAIHAFTSSTFGFVVEVELTTGSSVDINAWSAP